MRSSIKKNLVIIVEQEQQTSPQKSSKFQKYSPVSKIKPQYRTETLIPSYQTPKNKSTQSEKELKVSRGKVERVLHMKSSSFEQQDVDIKNLKLRQKISGGQSQKSLIENKRRLYFVSRQKTCQGVKCVHENKLKVLLNKIKKVFKNLEELLAETYVNFGKMIHEMGKQFERQFKSYPNITVFKFQPNISEQPIKFRSKIQIPARQKINQLPLLDLSRINDDTTADDHRHQIQKNRRQVQTQRNAPKNFQFSHPGRVNRKFSAFNETLNRLKRLSFEGSILKL